MPSPVAHSLFGYGLSVASQGRAPSAWSFWKWALLFVVLANLPDLDFLPGFLVGAPSAFHREMGTHSLAAALVCGAAVGAWLWARGGRFPVSFALASAAYASHLLLDLFSGGPGDAAGILLFWPFSGEMVLSPQPLFMSIEKSGAGGDFLASLLSAHNARAALRELVVVLPFVAAAHAWAWLRRRQRRQQQRQRKQQRQQHVPPPSA